jgi:hypothetical protein
MSALNMWNMLAAARGRDQAEVSALWARIFHGAEKLGDDMDYEVDVVDHIPLAPSGKFQTIIPLEPAVAVPT